MNKQIRKAVRTFLIEDNKVVAIKYKKETNKGYYDIPGGKIEENETSIQAAIREFKEETGIEIINPIYVGNAIIEYPDKIFDMDLYIAHQYIGETQRFDENDSMWIKIDDLLKEQKIFASIEILKYIDEKKKFNIKIFYDRNHKLESIQFI